MSVQKTAVRYDGKKHNWLAIRGGEVTEFPAGKLGKQGAMMKALENDQPQIFEVASEIIRQHDGSIALTDRVFNAVKILIQKRLTTDLNADGSYFCESSQGTNERYQVIFGGIPQTATCDCLAYTNGMTVDTSYGPVCQHILSVIISELIESKVTPVPEPVKSNYYGKYGYLNLQTVAQQKAEVQLNIPSQRPRGFSPVYANSGQLK